MNDSAENVGLELDNAPLAVVVHGNRIVIPVLTVAGCRAWMEYMQELGASGDVDLVGSSITPTLTLDELYYQLPDLGDGELEDLPVDEVLAIEAAVVGSNPDKDKPTLRYNAEHFAMQKAYKSDNTIAIVSYIAGGVFTAAAVALFVVDRGGAKEEKKGPGYAPGGGVAFAPAVAPGYYGVAGVVTF